jgi:hypothetical protein
MHTHTEGIIFITHDKPCTITDNILPVSDSGPEKGKYSTDIYTHTYMRAAAYISSYHASNNFNHYTSSPQKM